MLAPCRVSLAAFGQALLTILVQDVQQPIANLPIVARFGHTSERSTSPPSSPSMSSR